MTNNSTIDNCVLLRWKAFLGMGVYYIECPYVGRPSLKRVFTILSVPVLKAFLEEGVYYIECPCVGRPSLKRVFTILSALVLEGFP